jgi:hypothetical protein
VAAGAALWAITFVVLVIRNPWDEVSDVCFWTVGAMPGLPSSRSA